MEGLSCSLIITASYFNLSACLWRRKLVSTVDGRLCCREDVCLHGCFAPDYSFASPFCRSHYLNHSPESRWIATKHHQQAAMFLHTAILSQLKCRQWSSGVFKYILQRACSNESHLIFQLRSISRCRVEQFALAPIYSVSLSEACGGMRTINKASFP